MTINIEAILRPIREGAPCGDDFAFSSEFDAIQEAKREDDASLEQGEWVSEVKQADWNAVVRLSQELLINKTKDLRVAIWLAEGLSKTQGFVGLAKGALILNQLIVHFWSDIHPQAEDGDQELRIGALTRFVNYSKQIIRQIALTAPAPQGVAAYSSIDYESARNFAIALEKNPDLRDEMSNTQVTIDRFSEAQRKTPRSFYEKLLSDFQEAREQWKMLGQCIDERLGLDGPSFSSLFDTFETVALHVNRLTKEAGIANLDGKIEASMDQASHVQAPSGALASASPHNTPHAQEHSSMNGPIQSRDQAIQQLALVAKFFERTEPHSPVAYLVKKAVLWADMPLHEWLRTVVRDGGALAHIEELLGVQQNSD
jgi:type VI secretion system protein ImpA